MTAIPNNLPKTAAKELFSLLSEEWRFIAALQLSCYVGKIYLRHKNGNTAVMFYCPQGFQLYINGKLATKQMR